MRAGEKIYFLLRPLRAVSLLRDARRITQEGITIARPSSKPAPSLELPSGDLKEYAQIHGGQ